ncbi:hypothetical protein QF046_002989 [Microbacterium sp. W4I4]|nr:hypothetical protein [Microbacterium sp. W4I4]
MLRQHESDAAQGDGAPVAPLRMYRLRPTLPPRGERKRGEWAVYRVNDEAVSEIYLRLGQIGEI